MEGIKQKNEEPINYSDRIKAESDRFENRDLACNNTINKNQDVFDFNEMKNVNLDNVKSVESTSNEYIYLWIFYPFLLLLLSYVYNLLTWESFNIDFANSVARMMGSATFLFIIPLIIVGIRRIFTKEKLSSRSKVLLFYGVSSLCFYLSLRGHL